MHPDFEYYKVHHPRRLSNYHDRTQEQLIEDVKIAHDFIKQLVREKDWLRAELFAITKKLAQEQGWRKLLLTALGLSWATWIAAIWWLAKITAPLVIKGLEASH